MCIRCTKDFSRMKQELRKRSANHQRAHGVTSLARHTRYFDFEEFEGMEFLSVGSFPETLNQRILAGMILVGRLGVCRCASNGWIA